MPAKEDCDEEIRCEGVLFARKRSSLRMAMALMKMSMTSRRPKIPIAIV